MRTLMDRLKAEDAPLYEYSIVQRKENECIDRNGAGVRVFVQFNRFRN